MRQSIKVYVPSVDGASFWVDSTEELLAALFGGTTTTHSCLGSWLDLNGNLVVEPVFVIESIESEQGTLQPNMPQIRQHCAKMRDELRQQCIMVTVQPCEVELI